MTTQPPDVKRIADWIDRHPRTGWYVALWAGLLTLDAVVGLFESVARLIAG